MQLQRHLLNKSSSKQTYSFSKGPRLPALKLLQIDRFYDIPTTRSKRSCSFGVGSKSQIRTKTEAPPIGSYQIPGIVDQIGKRRISFGYGRNQLAGGIFNQQNDQPGPGPGQYSVQQTDIGNSGNYTLSSYKNPIVPSLKSRPVANMKQVAPGPGNYEDKTGLSPDGKYSHSKNKASLVRTFAKGRRAGLANKSTVDVPGPGYYPIFSQFGKQ